MKQKITIIEWLLLNNFNDLKDWVLFKECLTKYDFFVAAPMRKEKIEGFNKIGWIFKKIKGSSLYYNSINTYSGENNIKYIGFFDIERILKPTDDPNGGTIYEHLPFILFSQIYKTNGITFSRSFHFVNKDREKSRKEIIIRWVKSQEKIIKFNKIMNLTFWAHNFSRYDGKLIAKYLELSKEELNITISYHLNENKLVVIEIFLKYRKRSITLYCRYLLITQRLEIISKSFKLDIGKIYFPYKDLEFNNLEIKIKDVYLNKDKIRANHLEFIRNNGDKSFIEYTKEYVIIDVYILGERIVKFHKLYEKEFRIRVDFGAFITASRLSIVTFIKKFHEDSCQIINIQGGKLIKFIRDSYYGGRTEIFTGFDINTKHITFDYDFNSIYGNAIKHDLPVGIAFWIKKNHGLAGKFNSIELLRIIENFNLSGFAKVEISCPESTYLPLLPVKTKINSWTKTIFPRGKIMGTYYIPEIIFALKNKYTIHRTLEIVLFRKAPVLLNYSKIIIDLKLDAKYNKDKLREALYKLLLNGLYGKFGIKPETTKTIVKENSELYDKKIEYIRIDPIENRSYRFCTWRTTSDSKYRNVALSSAITAQGRIILNTSILIVLHTKGYKLMYCDTDSIFISGKYSPEGLKLYDDFVWETQGISRTRLFIAPKFYWTNKTPNELGTLKIKGIPKSSLRQVTVEELQLIKSGKPKINIFFKDIEIWFKKKTRVTNKYIDKTLRPFVNPKRELVYDINGIWTGVTKAIFHTQSEFQFIKGSVTFDYYNTYAYDLIETKYIEIKSKLNYEYTWITYALNGKHYIIIIRNQQGEFDYNNLENCGEDWFLFEIWIERDAIVVNFMLVRIKNIIFIVTSWKPLKYCIFILWDIEPGFYRIRVLYMLYGGEMSKTIDNWESIKIQSDYLTISPKVCTSKSDLIEIRNWEQAILDRYIIGVADYNWVRSYIENNVYDIIKRTNGYIVISFFIGEKTIEKNHVFWTSRSSKLLKQKYFCYINGL